MSKREVRVGNAMIEYSGSDHAVERLNATDRIEEELLLQVKTWLVAGGSLPLARQARRLLSNFSTCYRCCQWGSCTTPMCGTPSIFQLRTNLNNSTGTVMGHGKPVASPAKVSICSRVSAFVGLGIWWGVCRGVGVLFTYWLKNNYVHITYKPFCLPASSHLIYLDLSGYFGCQIELRFRSCQVHATFSPKKFENICETMQNQHCHIKFPSCGFTGHNLY